MLRRVLCTVGVAAVVCGCSDPTGVTIAAPPAELRPPMGWNSWNSGIEVDDKSIRETADAMVSSGMKGVGYEYVNVDAGWSAHERNSDGELVPPDPLRFPFGLKPLVDYVHARGLRFGLYSSPFNQTCGQGVGTASLGHEAQDAATFAAWGVDFLKYDWCGTDASHDQQVEVFGTMGSALRHSGRRIVYSINKQLSGPPHRGRALRLVRHCRHGTYVWRSRSVVALVLSSSGRSGPTGAGGVQRRTRTVRHRSRRHCQRRLSQ